MPFRGEIERKGEQRQPAKYQGVNLHISSNSQSVSQAKLDQLGSCWANGWMDGGQNRNS